MALMTGAVKGIFDRIERVSYFSILAFVNFTLRVVPGFSARRVMLTLLGWEVAEGVTIHRSLTICGFKKVVIGKNSTLNQGVLIDNRCELRLGENVTIARGCRLHTLGHDVDCPNFSTTGADINIGDYAVLFANVAVMPGVDIGYGAVVLPYSVVSKDVGELEVWGGVPAIKKRKRRLHNFSYIAAYPQWLGN